MNIFSYSEGTVFSGKDINDWSMYEILSKGPNLKVAEQLQKRRFEDIKQYKLMHKSSESSLSCDNFVFEVVD